MKLISRRLVHNPVVCIVSKDRAEVESLVDALHCARESLMPWRNPNRGYRQTYWWADNHADLRWATLLEEEEEPCELRTIQKLRLGWLIIRMPRKLSALQSADYAAMLETIMPEHGLLSIGGKGAIS